MTTKNPRLTITISPSLAVQLRQLSKLTNQSQAGLISSLLEGSGAVFERVITVLEAAEEAAAAARWEAGELEGHLTDGMREAQERIERQLGLTLVLDQNEATKDLLEGVDRIQRRARKTPTSALAPGVVSVANRRVANPLSNRGGRSRPEAAKTSTKSRS
jgi:hypothetical protein